MGWKRVSVAGRAVMVPEETSGGEIMQQAGIPGDDGNRNLVQYSGGASTVVPRTGKVWVQDGDEFEDLPVAYYGA